MSRLRRNALEGADPSRWWYEQREDGWRVISPKGLEDLLTRLQAAEAKLPPADRKMSKWFKERTHNVLASLIPGEQTPGGYDASKDHWSVNAYTNEQLAKEPSKWPDSFVDPKTEAPFVLASAMPGPIADGLEAHGGGPGASSSKAWIPWAVAAVLASAAGIWYWRTAGGKKPFTLPLRGKKA